MYTQKTNSGFEIKKKEMFQKDAIKFFYSIFNFGKSTLNDFLLGWKASSKKVMLILFD